MKPRRPVNLTSPGSPGAFLFRSSQPCNRAAQAPAFAFTDGLPSALPLSPFRPVPPRLAEARPLAAPSALSVRPPLVILARPVPRRFPCPVPPFAVPGLPLPLPRLPACRRHGQTLSPARCRHRAAPEGRQPMPLPVITVRAAAARRRQNGGLRIKGR
jgi:hypothetical protein